MTQTVQRNGMSVQRQVHNLQPCTVMSMGSWSTHDQSCTLLFNRQPCTVPLDCCSAEITGTLDSQSAESCSIYSPVLCR